MFNFRMRTDNSLLYSTISVKKAIKITKQNSENTLVMVDKDYLFGVIDFYKKCQDSKIKPIIGLELLVHSGSSLKDRDKKAYPLILIANNFNGYKKLMYLSSKALTDGFYRVARINEKTLIENKDDLTIIEPWKDGEINFLEPKEKKKHLENRKNIYNKNYYIGLGIKDKEEKMFDLLKDVDIKTLPAQEQVFLEIGDEESREVYRIIGDKKTEQLNGLFVEKEGDQYHLASEKYLEENLGQETIKNARNLVDEINIDLNLGDPIPPKFKYTQELSEKDGLVGADDKEYFTYKCKEMLQKRLMHVDKKKHEDYKKRLDYEMKIINDMSFPGYMLIVWDFVRVAREMGIAVGPGRGSAAGSLVAYALEITDIDPIKYDLLFERFLNPERVSMPDIDMDFMQARRGEIISYVVQKYGYDKVAQITTFSTLLPKGELKDIGKVFGVGYSQTDQLSKLIPADAKTLQEATDESEELSEFFTGSAKGKKVLENANKLEGLQRNKGMHAAGVVISDNPLWEKTPLYISEDESSLITQYSLNFLEDVDLIKFDFLGLKTLDVIDNAIKMINKNHNLNLNVYDLDIDDPKIYQMLGTGKTVGLFQVESPGMQSLNKKMQPDGFNDLIAILALYRPGPMNSGMLDNFVERKHGRQEISYLFKELEPILNTTYGIPVYQEQIMKMVQVIGGFSLGGSDIVRRAMGKKKPEVMAKYETEFIDGARSQNLDTEKAKELFEIITGFAEYGFNKSHSAAYAMITAQTAWLKVYYPAEFMACLMTSVHDSPNKISVYLNHCLELGLEIVPPSVNSGALNFEAYKKKIYYGLEMIKGVGHKVAINIIESKPKKDGFIDLFDFLKKIDNKLLKKDTFEYLASAGALDLFSYSRKELVENSVHILKETQKYTNTIEEFNKSIFHNNSNHINFDFNIKSSMEWNILDKYSNEIQSLGICISIKDPLYDYKKKIEGVHYDSYSESVTNGGGCKTLLVNIDKVEIKYSKKGNVFYIIHATDSTSSFSGIVFGSTGSKYIDASEEEKKAPWEVEVEIEIKEESTGIKFKKLIPRYDPSVKMEISSKEIVVFYKDENNQLLEEAKKVNGNQKTLVFIKLINNAKQLEIENTKIEVDVDFIKKNKEKLATKYHSNVKKYFSQ